MSFDEWEKTVPETFKADTLWKMKAYRLALYLSDLCWQDASVLLKDKRTVSLANQLYRAVGSVSANLAEGYSRSTGKDRALFYQYALGSARESRDWYYKARFVLGDEISKHREQVITEILRLLLTMIPNHAAMSSVKTPRPTKSTPTKTAPYVFRFFYVLRFTFYSDSP